MKTDLHQPVRRKSCTLKLLLQMSPSKILPWKPSGSSSLFSMRGLYSLLGVFSKHCTYVHHILGSVNWLCFLVGKWMGLSRWCRGKESTGQCRSYRRCGFDPWVGKILWRRKWEHNSSILAWKNPIDREEPRGLQSKGLQRVRHDWATEHARMGESSTSVW